MKKTTGTSVAKKVLCSALSAAMVVAFAPAVGNAVGSGDGTAYAAERLAANDSGQEAKFDLGGKEYHAIGSATSDTAVWINPTKPDNWKSTVGRIKIDTTILDMTTGWTKQAYSDTDFELGDWCTKNESGEYTELESAPKENGDYYLRITAKDNSFVTGSGYVRVQVNVTSRLHDGAGINILSDETASIEDPTKIHISMKDLASRLRSLELNKDYKVAGYDDEDVQLHGWLQQKKSLSGNWWENASDYFEQLTAEQVKNSKANRFFLHVVGLNDYEGCEGYIEIVINDANSFYGYQFMLNGEKLLDEAPADPSSLKVIAKRKSGEEGSVPVQGTDYTVDNKWYTAERTDSGMKYSAYVDDAGNAKKPDKAGEYYLKVVHKDGSSYSDWSEGAQVGYISVLVTDYTDIGRARVTIPGLANNSLVTSDLTTLPDLNVAYAGKILTKGTDYTVSWAKLKDGATDESSNSPEDFEETDHAVNGASHILISGVKDGGFSGKQVVHVSVLDPENLSNYYGGLSSTQVRASVANGSSFDMQSLKENTEAYRWSSEGKVVLDNSKYTLDGKWYTRDDKTLTYTALENASKLAELADGIIYVKLIPLDANAQKDAANCCYAGFQFCNDMNLKSYFAPGDAPSVKIADDMMMPSVDSLRWLGWIDGERVSMDLAKNTGYTQDSKWYVLDEDGTSDADNPVCKAIEGNPTAAGQYYVRLEGKAPYAGECYVRVFVDKDNDLGSFTWYAGSCYLNDLLDPAKFEPVVDRMPDGVDESLAKGTDYTVEGKWYEDKALAKTVAKPTKAGTYYVKLVGKGAYEGSTVAVPVLVMDSYSLENYKAEELKYWEDDIPNTIPIIVRSNDGEAVLDSSCYTVSDKWETDDDEDNHYVEKPTEPGWYYKTITGKDTYKGKLTVDLRVVSTKNFSQYSAKQAGIIEVGANKDDVKFDVYRTLSDGTVKPLTQGTDFKVDGWFKWTDDEQVSSDSLSEAGTYYVKLVGTGKYEGKIDEVKVIVGQHEHDIYKVGTVSSTCSVKGHKEYWVCDGCGKMFSDENGEHEIEDESSVELPLAAHTPDGGTTVAAATCTTGGKVEYRCKKCGKVTSTATTAALGHSFSSGSISWTGGGVSSATGTFTCSRDPSHKETVTASISKTLTVKPTCTAKGTNTYTATAVSSTGTKVTSTKTAQDEPALGHAYGPYTVTVQPTATSTGVATAKCTRSGCTSTVTKTVQKLKSEQAASVTGASVSATVTDAKPATTPNGTSVVGSVAIDKVSASSTATKVEVPETVTIKGAEYAVTSIDAKAFAGNAKVESVKLPDTLSSIPAGLFEGCASLKEASLPSKVTEIPADTFNGTALASVSVPATVTKVGARAFKGTELSAVVLPASVESMGKDAFKGCGKLVTATLPATLKTVPAGAFDGCAALKGVALAGVKPLAATTAATPATVDVSSATTIGANAFRNCKSVTAIDASGAKTIGAGAFKGAFKLASLKTGSKLKGIGSNALSGAKKVKTLNVKSKKLTKSGVKGALKGSSVKTVKVAVSGSKATKAKYIAKYKKIFTAKNCGKKVSVK